MCGWCVLLTTQGLGEGVALPSMSNMVAAHVPPSAKARALGMSFTGFHTGTEGVGMRHPSPLLHLAVFDAVAC